jgi:protein gp37
MQTTIEWTWRRVPATFELLQRLPLGLRKMGAHAVETPGTEHPAMLHIPGFTFNPWRGCEEVPDSPACDHCYAKALAKRNPETLGVWGHHAPRAIGTEDYWQQPHKWNRMAEEMGVELNVFCLSLGDWLEDHPALVEHRARLLKTIHATPWLRWLLLTKRPENWYRLVSAVLDHCDEATAEWLEAWTDCVDMPDRGDIPPNVRIGITAENQFQLEKRLPEMLKIPAPGYFISAEPLLGELHIGRTLLATRNEELRGRVRIITGGESGAGDKTRPSHPFWFDKLRIKSRELGFEFFFKQWGDWAPRCGGIFGTPDWTAQGPSATKWLSVRMTEGGFDSRTGLSLVPGAVEVEDSEDIYVQRVGKHNAGRLLHGREWNGDLSVTNGRGV